MLQKTVTRKGIIVVKIAYLFRLKNICCLRVRIPLNYRKRFKVKEVCMNPRVSSVVALSDYKLRLQFNNGGVGMYDCSYLLDFGVFKELKDKNYFMQAKAWGGTVVCAA